MYTDDMSVVENTMAKQYDNLTIHTPTDALLSLQDKDFMKIENILRTEGSVTYRVTGAKSIAVSTYHVTGTTVYKGTDGKLRMDNQMGGVATVITPMYSKTSGRVYVLNESKPEYLVYDDLALEYVFKPTTEYPSDLVPYSVVIYTSVDGTAYTVTQQKRIQSVFHPTALLHLESWAAVIPDSAKYIKIVVNDVQVLENQTATDRFEKKATAMPMVANIEIVGDKMVFGVPAPDLAPADNKDDTRTPIIIQSIDKQKTTEEEKVTAKKETTVEKETAVKTIEPKQETKTEEVKPDNTQSSVTTPTQPQQQTTSKPKTPIVTTDEPSAASEPPTDKPDETLANADEEDKIYYIEPIPEKQDNFSEIVVAYIIIVVSVLLIIVIKARMTTGKPKEQQD